MKLPTLVTESAEVASEMRRIHQMEHKREFRKEHGKRLNKERYDKLPDFIGIDSEGVGQGNDHRCVLIGAANSHYSTMYDTSHKGLTPLHYTEIFEFLYQVFEDNPRSAFVGFYLSYDFNMWLKTLPYRAAYMLLTDHGKELRTPRKKTGWLMNYPVYVDGWQIDILGFKRLSIRPSICDCRDIGKEWKECKHNNRNAWMHICDAGAFWQMPLLDVLDKKNWEKDPMGQPISDEDLELIIEGKSKRATAELNDDMRFYNYLENVALSEAMTRLASGMQQLGIRLHNKEWYGPGAMAGKWLDKEGVPRRTNTNPKKQHIATVENSMPAWAIEISKESFYGGWFEIFSHGLIKGKSWNYDINNAYPYGIMKLPCIIHGEWKRGAGSNPSGDYVLCYGRGISSNDRIGGLPFRTSDGRILRPHKTIGWYWHHEIEAAKYAGILDSFECREWMQYIPDPSQCNDHSPNPCHNILDMYNERKASGKGSAKGMVIKLTNNSDYGKFAQSVGTSPFGNWFYASYITSHCRTQILEAIASHPGGYNSTLMVATDGVVFDSKHPSLSITKELGEWEETEYDDLILFKPGVYWYKDGKDAVLKSKTRGVPRKNFMQSVRLAELVYEAWHKQQRFDLQDYDDYYRHEDSEEIVMIKRDGKDVPMRFRQDGWPVIRVLIEFSMISCRQALMGSEKNWDKAGQVQEPFYVLQSASPEEKRCNPHWNKNKQRLDTSVRNLEQLYTVPYGKANMEAEDWSTDCFGPDGYIDSSILYMLSMLHDEPRLESGRIRES